MRRLLRVFLVASLLLGGVVCATDKRFRLKRTAKAEGVVDAGATLQVGESRA
jgi:cytochrome c-type biogenesis protein CcmF